MKKSIIFTFAAASCLMAMAESSPLWLRNTSISPDGKVIAFTYQGDIFTVPVSGGQAKQITSNSAYDTKPVWSPDGKRLVFASDREGSMDIYSVDACGGTPIRITTNSASEKPLVFLNDSTLLFATMTQPSQQSVQSATQSQVYKVNINGGRPKLFSSLPMTEISVNKNGNILYQDRKGVEDIYRKHERSSGTSDIWLITDKGNQIVSPDTKYTKLTSFNGHDLNPVWTSDNEYFYISEQDGTLNVYRRNINGKESQLTKFTNHPVRSLSASDNGTLAFSWNGEIYAMQPNGEPKKVDVIITADNYDNDLVKGYRSSGASNFAVSPTGEEVAFILRGDVYVTSVKYETTKRITNTDAQERCLSFSPDGRTLVYDSDRDGKWQLFTAKIKNDAEKSFTYCTDIIEEPLYSSDKAAQQPVFSPDGKKVAFLEDRVELKVIDVDSKAVNTALDGKYNYSYSDGDIDFSWSPDSRWLTVSYIGIGGWNNSDVAIVRDNGSEVIDLTESGYADNGSKWALDGKAITYASGKNGYKSHGSWGEEQDVYIMVLDPEAWDDFNMTEEEIALKEKSENKDENKDGDKKDGKDKKDKKGKKKDKKADKEADKDKVEPLNFDVKNRHYRTARLTNNSSHLADYWLSKKGDKLYYIAQSTEDSYNLYVHDIKKDETSVLSSNVSPSGIIADEKGENIYILSGGIKKIAVPSGTTEVIKFSAPYSRHPSAERAYIFDHAWQQVADKFYDADIHGIDWKQYGEDYRKFLPYINNNYDFTEMLSEMLGELNASHTGSGYRPAQSAMGVGNLGAFFDESYDGDGLKVTEVIARGPLATKKANVAPGDIIVSIDGEKILNGTDYYPLLEGKSGKKVRLGVQKANGKLVYSEVKPISNISNLLYNRWVERNEAIVDSVSGGKVGYVHVRAMDSPSFREVYSKLLGKYRNCDAVVVDTRYNGGGWLHNDIALLLNGKEYVKYCPRGKFIGKDPFSQWTKPSAMLVNESNYSDAHGTPYVYQTLKIGDIVGAPVPGTMTAVWWEFQIDPTIYFGIPQVTSVDENGRPLENQQLNPDIEVYNNPADVERGIDSQLIEATKSLLNKIAE